MDSKDKIIDLARKLKALSDRGIGGEKDNALSKLNLVMKKYNISLQDISGEFRKDFEFELSKDIDFLFIGQVLSSVVGRSAEYGCDLKQFKYIRKRGFISYLIENIEPELFSEFIIKVELFWDNYKKERQIFYEAYIQANRLFVKSSGKDSCDRKELTPEERARLFKISNMMVGIDTVKYQKRLGDE